MAGPGDLYDIATEFLDIMAEALDTIPDSSPSRRGTVPPVRIPGRAGRRLL